MGVDRVKHSVQVPPQERRHNKCSHVAAKDVPGRLSSKLKSSFESALDLVEYFIKHIMKYTGLSLTSE